MGCFIWGYTQAGDPITDIDQFDAVLADIATRRIGYTDVGPMIVITTHLVVDSNHLHRGNPPITFETYVTAAREGATDRVLGLWEGFTRRYSSRAHAEKGHEQTVHAVAADIRRGGQ